MTDEFEAIANDRFCNPEFSQIELIEARALYGAVRELKPRTVVEVGTGMGGGTTYFTAAALHKNNLGRLHTIEMDIEYSTIAHARFRAFKDRLLPHVRFWRGSGAGVIASWGAWWEPIDWLTIDGGAGVAPVAEIEAASKHMPAGAYLCVHDWYADKTAEARKHLEDSRAWDFMCAVGTEDMPAVYRRNVGKPGGVARRATGIAFLRKA